LREPDGVSKVSAIVKNVDLSPVAKAAEPLWNAIRERFAEHHLITVVCGFFVVLMTLSFYRFLKSISPGLVAFIFLLMFGILVMHWTLTRTEPAFLKPAIDFLAPFFPTSPNFAAPVHPKH